MGKYARECRVQHEGMHPSDVEDRKVSCPCGWEGCLSELELPNPDGEEECPSCGGIGFEVR